MANNNNSRPSNPSRRKLLKSAGLMGAAAVGSSAAGSVIAAEAPAPDNASPITLEALEVLTAEEAQILEAVCDRLIPFDDNGPGAKEARAAHYIDRSLASHNREDRHDYMVSLAAVNDYARQTYGELFYRLGEEQQDTVLLALQNDEVPGCSPSGSGFFNTVRSHTIDGTFCDPYYGGNQGFVGWDMIRYPGIRLSASETDVAQGANLEPNHQSAYDHETYTKMIENGGGGRDDA